MALDVIQPSSVHERPPSKGRRQCSCCPYGYHIDLDFVRYCESITNAQLMPSASVRRSRWNNVRRKRASREALLGLDIKTEPLILDTSLVKISSDIGEDLRKAVLDFEKTLKHASLPRTKKEWNGSESLECASSNLGNHISHYEKLTSLTLPRMPSRSAREVMTYVPPIEEMLFSNANNASAETLQNIREQMAASLRRMKELEERIKIIPQLNDQIGGLKKENDKLRNDLNSKESQLIELTTVTKSVSDKTSSTQDLVHTRAAAVGCTVLTREIGISPSRIQTRSVATETNREIGPSTEHIATPVSLHKIICSQEVPRTNDASCMTEVVRFLPNEKTPVPKERVERRSKGVSTEIGMEDFVTVEEMNRRVKEVQIELSPPSKSSIKVNTHLLHDQIFTQDDLDEQVARFAKTYESNFLSSNLAKKASQVSVGVQATNKVERKHFGLQTQTKVNDMGILAKPKSSAAAIQASPLTKTVGVSNNTTSLDPCERCNVKKTSIGTLYPDRSELLLQRIRSSPEMTVAKRKTVSRSTDTGELLSTKDVSLNTLKKKLVSTAMVTGDYSCKKCSSSQAVVANPSASRLSAIPTPAKRPSYLPISVHRVKTPHSPSPQHHSLQHEGSNSDSGSDDGTYTIHQDVDSHSKPETLSEHSPINPQDHVRREPSMEMRGAMKVLNDALLKSSGGDIPKHVKTAVNIVQQEWFKVSSTASANPLDVEYYLDCFEEISGTLLEHVVNMVDVSGNTAMHYAVSNGNFDVVSILLDSKVCNINKLNTAGYTCIMLVALTKVKSETDREVVRRLFHLADVNIRAKEHGQTALMLAVSHGRLDTVELLLEAGADINIQDEDGSTALMCAAEHGYIEIVKLLLAQPDCDLSITDYDGTTALAIAMEAGNRDIGVLLYAQEHFSRGSSPYTSMKHKRSKSTTPTLKSSRPTTPSHSSHKKDSEHDA